MAENYNYYINDQERKWEKALAVGLNILFFLFLAICIISFAGSAIGLGVFSIIVLLIMLAPTIKANLRLRRLNFYAYLIANDSDLSLDHMAEMAKRPVDKVTAELAFMIKLGHLLNINLDLENRRLVFPGENITPVAAKATAAAPVESQIGKTVVCKGCGATAVIQNDGGQYCEYCGNKLI